eukprot:1136852-Pelagomonas_calceolata.AAC.4
MASGAYSMDAWLFYPIPLTVHPAKATRRLGPVAAQAQTIAAVRLQSRANTFDQSVIALPLVHQ